MEQRRYSRTVLIMKKILLAFLAWPLLALAQSYPSPTYSNLTVNGAFTATGTFTATGKVGLSNLASQAANTVVANFTASSASPTAVALPSCSTANSALQYTSGTGLSCGTAFGLTTGTLAQFAATTSAQLAGIISDETGSGALVFGTGPAISGPTVTGGSINNTPIGATTASTGAFTTLSASGAISGTGFSTYLASPPAIGGTTANTGRFTTLTTTGAYTPSSTAGIVGTATNDNANAGSIGEFLEATSTSTSLTNGSYVDLSTVSATAGDWDVQCSVQFNGSSLLATAFVVGVNTVANTNPNSAKAGANIQGANFPAGGLATPVVRESIASTTIFRCGAQANFGSGTATGIGYIRARRVR